MLATTVVRGTVVRHRNIWFLACLESVLDFMVSMKSQGLLIIILTFRAQAAERRPSRLRDLSLTDIVAENEAMHGWWCSTQQNANACSLKEKIIEVGGSPNLDSDGQNELIRMHKVT